MFRPYLNIYTTKQVFLMIYDFISIIFIPSKLEINKNKRYSFIYSNKWLLHLMSKLTLQLLPEIFSIHSLPAQSKIPEQVFAASIYFIGKTNDEVSIVLPEHISLESDEVEHNWKALEVVGPLGFSLTGILSNISGVLASEKISIFAVSTFDTDYILVKSKKVHSAVKALQANDYHLLGY